MTAGAFRPQPNSSGPGKRRGRPPGSVSLTAEIERLIVDFTRAGAFAHVAAQAAGISPRTLSEWMARGRGEHPTRPCTPKLKAFVRKVEQAQAEARLAAEIEVYRNHPKHWLRYVARSRPDSEGWSDLKNDPFARGPTLEERLREIHEGVGLQEN